MMLPTVLLADADRDSRIVYSLMLEHHGYQVLQASDGTEAHRLACERRPDLVVTELFLPYVEGEPLPVRLRCDERTATTAILGLTVLPARLGLAPGLLACDAHLIKPCSPSRLLLEVRRLLEAPRPARPGRA